MKSFIFIIKFIFITKGKCVCVCVWCVIVVSKCIINWYETGEKKGSSATSIYVIFHLYLVLLCHFILFYLRNVLSLNYIALWTSGSPSQCQSLTFVYLACQDVKRSQCRWTLLNWVKMSFLNTLLLSPLSNYSSFYSKWSMTRSLMQKHGLHQTKSQS